MKRFPPHTPFATQLSGSVKETELRIRSIFQPGKKRPPIWMITLAALVILACGGLVSCQQQKDTINVPQYLDAFSTYEYTGALSYRYEDRTVILEDIPQNIAEEVVTNHYLFAASGDFDSLYALMGSSALQISAKNEGDQFDEGLYFTSTVIHELSTLTADDLSDSGLNFDAETPATDFAAELLTLAQEHGLAEYTVVHAGLSWKWSQAALEQGPQAGDGRHERFFLLGRIGPEDNWKIYELFWGDDTQDIPSHFQLANQLAQQELEYISPEYQEPNAAPLLAHTVGDQTLILVRETSGPHVAGIDNLLLGVWDQSEYAFVGDIYSCRGGLSSWTYWEEEETLYLLWSNCAVNHGWESSSGIGYFSFDSNGLQQLTTLPDPARNTGLDFPEDALTLSTQANDDYWYDHKAVPATGGLDLYARTEGYGNMVTGDRDIPQWTWLGFVPFTEGTPSSLFGMDTNMHIIKAPILEHFQNKLGGKTVYWAVDQPDQPQLGDYRLENLTYSGMSRLYKTAGVAYEITVSCYYSRNQTTPPEWHPTQEFLVLSYSGSDNSFLQVLGSTSSYSSGKPVEYTIQKIAWDLIDPDVCLYRDGYPQPLGPGNWQESLFPSDLGQPTVEILDGWEPIYNTGDYWDRFSIDGLTALRYYNVDTGKFVLNTLDVTLNDFYTPAGIRVGSTRTEVLAAYPGNYDTHYWHDTDPDFPGQDYLWYCDNPEGWGAAILLFFENDIVTRIRLDNMFN